MSASGDQESDEEHRTEHPTELDCPDSENEIFESVAPDCDDFRPVCQGDIFKGICLPGFDDGHHDHVVLVGHPCSLRAGPKLKPHLQAVAIRGYQSVPLERWGTSHLRVFPLPSLQLGIDHPAAILSEAGTVKPEEITLDKRVATLSPRGILLLQQRIVWTAAHTVIRLSTLKDFNGPVLTELELLEFWNEELCGHLEGEERAAALLDTAKQFENYIRGTGLQAQLEEVNQIADARRQIRAEAIRRSAERSSDG
ncbi:MAG TPA: hypothetical protein VGL54_08860 [Solirubrobacteraceae bacterium]